MFPLLKTTVSQGLPRSQGNFASTDRSLDNLHLGLCQLFDSDQTHVVSGPAVVDRQGLHIVHDGLRCRSVRRFGCSRYFFANMTEKSTMPSPTFANLGLCCRGAEPKLGVNVEFLLILGREDAA